MHALTHIHRSRDAHTSRCARTHNQWSRDVHKQTRTHTYARTQAHAHAHICKDKSTRARIAHSHRSCDAHKHTRKHIYARTQVNAQEHELSQSSVIRCTLVHAHALPRACALNGPEAYFHYYSY